ncbi:MAG: hypothetical protein JWO78_235 [Micavibrio sp.]|nr:hypothetical protein [Micavibrio sp.]
MILSKYFRRAVCAGLTACATATAAAAFPGLPLAEDLLVAHGINRNQASIIVQSLAGTRSIRILDKEGLEKIIRELRAESDRAKNNDDDITARQYKDMASIAVQVQARAKMGDPFLLPAVRDHLNFLQSLKPEHAAAAQAACYINPPTAADVRIMISSFTNIPPEYIESEIVTQKELFLFSILHEMAHCHPGNIAAGDTREARADLKALEVMKQISTNPAFIRNLTLLRIITPNFTTHNTGPFIDAETRGATPVTYDQILALHTDLMRLHNEKIVQMDMSTTKGKPFFLSAARVFSAILKEPPKDLSPLTQRYMELFVAAAKAIAPKAISLCLEGGASSAANTPQP